MADSKLRPGTESDQDRALSMWEDAMLRIRAGDHPPKPALAALVRFNGTPTREVAKYVAKRIEEEDADGRRHFKDLPDHRPTSAETARRHQVRAMINAHVDALAERYKSKGVRAYVNAAMQEAAHMFCPDVDEFTEGLIEVGWRPDEARKAAEEHVARCVIPMKDMELYRKKRAESDALIEEREITRPSHSYWL